MIVTIDGPAGSGKSSAARILARRLGFRFLDTGAMYRTVTLAAQQCQVDWHDQARLAEIAAQAQISLTDDQVLLDGVDVTTMIRTSDITALTRYAADSPEVRRVLIEAQHRFAEGRDVVAEGRDQATIVFPQAECKIYLTASEEVRARRRYADLLRRGETRTFDEVLVNQRLRDQRDLNREFGGLMMAEDSIEVNTDEMSAEEVVACLEKIVRARMPDGDGG